MTALNVVVFSRHAHVEAKYKYMQQEQLVF